MPVSDFKLSDDDECIQRLSDTFHLAIFSQYRAKMKTTYMTPVSGDNADVDDLQKYVGKFLGLLERNPQFLYVSKKRATQKIMNEIFIDGFSKAVFHNRVKSLVTTDITSTVNMLDSLYNELEIVQGWTSKPKSGPPGKAEHKYVNEEQKDFKPRPDLIKCTRDKCNSTRHTAAECYLLHPELRPDFRKIKNLSIMSWNFSRLDIETEIRSTLQSRA